MNDSPHRHAHANSVPNLDAHRGQVFYDNVFRDLTGSTGSIGSAWSADPAAEPGTGEQDLLSAYVRQIAGSLFCGSGIDPTVVGFATARAAERWGREEEEVDLMVGDTVLRTAAALMADLR